MSQVRQEVCDKFAVAPDFGATLGAVHVDRRPPGGRGKVCELADAWFVVEVETLMITLANDSGVVFAPSCRRSDQQLKTGPAAGDSYRSQSQRL